MKSLKILIPVFIGLLIIGVTQINSCKPPAHIQSKPGAVLWSENCSRCHNTPSPADFNNQQWEVITTHMRVRANLTARETEKIKKFLQTAN